MKKLVIKNDDIYLNKMDENLPNIYQTNKDEVLSNPKIEFRYLCFRYLNYIRNIKLPAKYLEDSYPLYFTNLNQVSDLLSIKNITKANKYLKNLDKIELKIEYFIKKIFSLINK